MELVDGALLVSGGVILAGIAYPNYARSQRGWRVGAWSGSAGWSVWFGLGALAYLAGMWSLYGWIGALFAIPLAFLTGLVFMLVVRRHVQLLSLVGPILANIWFVT
jgi:hypothetical protein